MAWTAPRTWTTGEVVTGSIMNQHVRDNLLETGPAKVTTAGDMLYATGANALNRLAIGASRSILASDGSSPLWRLQQVCRLQHTSNQAITTGTNTFLQFGTSNVDHGGMRSSMGAPNNSPSGTVQITNGGNSLAGSGTAFTTELAVGCVVKVGDHFRVIQTITNNTTATIRGTWGASLGPGAAYERTNRAVVIQEPGIYVCSAHVKWENQIARAQHGTRVFPVSQSSAFVYAGEDYGDTGATASAPQGGNAISFFVLDQYDIVTAMVRHEQGANRNVEALSSAGYYSPILFVARWGAS